MDNYHLTTLKNGLRLITVPMPQVESLTVMVGVGAGSRFETRATNGLAHFIEHMAFKGTKKRPTTKQIATEVESVGGEFNAFTDKEFTGYYLKLAAQHKILAFDILSDILTNSLLKQEEIEREKGVIIEELNLYEDTPYRRIWDVFIRLMYGDNPMGWDIAGQKETIRQISRPDFLAYLKRLYYPKNMVVIVAGKINQSEAYKLTHQFFTLPQKVGEKTSKSIKISQNQARVKLVNKKTEQAHFCLGVPAYELKHHDRHALAVLASILGGGMSSRLFLEIRERRGLAYYVDCAPELFTDSGYLMARAGVKTEKLPEAIKVMLSELIKITTKKPPAKEVAKAKEYNKGGLILALEDSRAVASRYAYQILLEKEIRTLKQTLALIDKVTPEDVLRVAKDLLRPEKLNLAIIGPYKDQSPFEKLLKL